MLQGDRRRPSSRSTASTTTARWSTRPRTAPSSTPSAASGRGRRPSREAARALARGPQRACTSIAARIEKARKEADFLRHAVEELTKLAPQAGEEASPRRAPHRHDAIREGGPGSQRGLRGGRRARPRRCRSSRRAVRKLERRSGQAPALVDPSVKALDAALVAIDEARAALEEAHPRDGVRPARAGADRGAAVRPAGRGAEIRRRRPTARGSARALRRRRRGASMPARSSSAALERRGRRRRHGLCRRRPRSSPPGAARPRKALDAAVQAELPPLKLERARFITEIQTDEASRGSGAASTASSSGRRPIPAPGLAR